MDQAKKWVAIVAVVVAAVMGSVAVWRSFPSHRDDALAYVHEKSEQGQEIYKQFKVENSLSDRDRIRAIVGDAPRSTSCAKVDVPIDPLFDLYADFVYYRFGQPDIDVYKKWRLDHGYKWRSANDMISIWGAKEGYAGLLGKKEVPAGATSESMFNDFWTVDLSYHPDVNWPVATCTDQVGLSYSIAVAKPENPRNAPSLGEDNDKMIWTGATATAGRCWFDPPRTRQQIMAQYGQLIVGQVAAVIEFQGGYRCPLVVSAIWDPSSDRWLMENIILYNRSIKYDAGMEY